MRPFLHCTTEIGLALPAILRYTFPMPPVKLIIAAMILLAGALSGCGMTSAVRLSDRQTIPVSRMIEEVKDAPLVFVGEIHDERAHHDLEEEVIRGMHATGRPMAIGLEMFNAESQPELDAWVAGRLDPARFAAVYARNWREPLELYAGILRFARENRVPLVGLNVPRALIQEVKRRGFAALPDEVRANLPTDVRCDVTGDYLAFMGVVNAGHSGNRESLSHFCEAMMLWNSLMARNLSAYLDAHPGTAVVVLAGVGHARKKWGIPEQLDGGEKRYPYRVVLPELPEIAGLPPVTSDDADYLVEEPWSALRRLLAGY